MQLLTEIIKTSCKGSKGEGISNQDFYLVVNNDEHLVTVVSDGLGSSVHSSDGAKLACRVVMNILVNKFDLLQMSSLSTLISEAWLDKINQCGGKPEDYRTTNLFVRIDKVKREILVGQLGDSFVAIRTDGNVQSLNLAEKDFINETECLGSNGSTSYLFNAYEYQNHFEFLIATDGIGDELILDKIGLLFDYLKWKYEKISPLRRNAVLKKEILKTMSDKNNDDKTLIFAWSNNS